jgi:hypothetical protein
MPNWKKVVVSGSAANLSSLHVDTSVTASIFSGSQFIGNLSGTASYAITASHALNVPSTGYNASASFSNLTTWNFNHNLNSPLVVIQTFDSNYNEILPQEINLTDSNNATITFPTQESGYALASVGGVLVTVNSGSSPSVSASYAVSASFAQTASFATTASYALTASFVEYASSFPFTGSAKITGSLGITGSLSTSGSIFVGGNIIPSVSKSFSLGSTEFPFKDIYISSGSLVIASDNSLAPSTTLSNVDGNILVSAGGMQLLGSGSFNATTGSFSYISGSLTQVGTVTRIGNTILSGSLFASGSITIINDANLITHNIKALGSNGLQILANNGAIIATMGQGGGSQANFTGSLSSTQFTAPSITGSLLGTASQAVSSSYALTASYVLNAVSASNAVTSSYALTASYVNPLVQTLQLTGSLLQSGSITLTSGSITMPNRPAFRVTGAGGPKSAVTALSGSYLVADYSQGSGWDISTGTFTAPIAGLYQVNVVVRTNSNTLDAISQLIVYKNNTGGTTGEVQIMIEFGNNTTMNHAGGSTISKLEVGDTLKMVVAAGTISFDANDNFSVAYLG